MAKSGDRAALRNKCAAVHNVALVAKNVEMAVLKARLSIGLRRIKKIPPNADALYFQSTDLTRAN